MMKKIIAFVLCLMMAASLLPAGILTALAAPEKVLFSEDFASANTPADLDGWAYSHDEYSESVIEDGALVIRNVASKPFLEDGANNGGWSSTIAKHFTGMLEEDAQNGTQLWADRFAGRYAIDMTFEPNFTSQRDGSHFRLYFGYGTAGKTSITAGIQIRLFASGLIVYQENGKSVSVGTMVQGEETQLRVMIDAVNQTAGICINGAEVYAIDGLEYTTSTSLRVFDSLQITTMQAFSEGSYVKIKKLELVELEPDTEDASYTQGRVEIPSALPSALTDDPANVTGNITLPGGTPATWTTDGEIIADDGKVTRWFDDVDTSVSAAYTVGTTNFEKRYYMTVKQRDDLDPAVLIEDFLDSADGWVDADLAGGGSGQRTLSGGALEVVKLTDGAADLETRDIKAFYTMHLLEQCVSDSAYERYYENAFSGGYDVLFDFTPTVTGDHPVEFDVGYYNWTDLSFTDLVAVKFYGSKISAYAPKTGNELSVSAEPTGGNTYRVRLRIDTDAKKAWVYMNDQLVSIKGLAYASADAADIPAFVNAVAVAVDERSASADKAVVENLRFERLVETPSAATTALKVAGDSVAIHDITASPDNVTGTISALPSTADGVAVLWSADSDQIDLTTGKVYHSEADHVVTLTGTFINNEAYPMWVTKTYALTVKGTSDAAALLEYGAYGLRAEKLTQQPADAIRYDVMLPTTDVFGNLIVWTSSNPQVLGADGKIGSGVISEDTAVTLSAVLTAPNGQTATVTNQFTVLKRGSALQAYTGGAISGGKQSFTVETIENAKFNTPVRLDLTVQPGSGEIVFCDADGNAVLTLICTAAALTAADHIYGLPANGEVSVLFIPEAGAFAMWLDGVLAADYVKTDRTFSDIASVQVSGEAHVTALDAELDTYTVLGFNAYNIDYFAHFPETGIVQSDLTLVRDAALGVAAAWKSADTTVISDTGALTVPEVYAFVDMTLVLSDGDFSAEHVYRCIVPCDSDKNLAKAAVVTGSGFAKAGHELDKATDGDYTTYYHATTGADGTAFITLDLGAAQYSSMLYVNQNLTDGYQGILRYAISKSDDGKNWETVETGTMSGQDNGFISYGLTNARYIRLDVLEADNGELMINELEVYQTGSKRELVQMDVETLVVDSEYVVASNLTLPTVGVNGTPILWQSSHPSVISTTGAVNRPETSTEVALTAYAYDGSTRYEKVFKFYVRGASGGTGGTGGSAGGGAYSTGVALPNTATTATEPENGNTAGGIFNDVHTGDWYYDVVLKLKDAGVVAGDENGNFNPNAAVTREQFVKMILEAIDVDLDVFHEMTDRFDDVDSNDWYAKYVFAAAAFDIVNGVSGTQFGTGQSILRQDMAVMIMRALRYREITLIAPENQTAETFADAAAVADYAREAVQLMKQSGLIEGYENYFNPMDRLTKAEAAAVLARVMELV